VSLDTKYLIKITVLCDDLKGDDYREAIKLVESNQDKEGVSRNSLSDFLSALRGQII